MQKLWRLPLPAQWTMAGWHKGRKMVHWDEWEKLYWKEMSSHKIFRHATTFCALALRHIRFPLVWWKVLRSPVFAQINICLHYHQILFPPLFWPVENNQTLFKSNVLCALSLVFCSWDKYNWTGFLYSSWKNLLLLQSLTWAWPAISCCIERGWLDQRPGSQTGL